VENHNLDALLIRRPSIDFIIGGKQTWDIRRSKTTIRGRIALVPSGSGTVTGICDIVECLGPLTPDQFRKNAEKAALLEQDADLGYHHNKFAWVLANPHRLMKSVPYKHPVGANTWVKLDRRVERKILDQLQSSPEKAVGRKPDSFALGEIVSIEYSDPFEEDTVIGIVVKKEESRMKVVFAWDTGETDISWLTRHDERVPNRWIDNTHGAIVRVEDATVSQREGLQRWVPLDRQAQLLKNERR
jgi:hypothetical protein